ncbi:MAG TPA: sigma-70 family RNA polymerase sigma factor [Polyangiales bacterium]|nr:sigma-70 family RNA polymerase sigma factor [Polyangiales bacterium]
MTTTIDAPTLAYMRRISGLPTLTREDELALARAWQKGDQAAGRRLLTANLRNVIPIALRYRRYGLPVGDLIAEGNAAMVRALARFEPERELRFATYANYWIRAEMLSHVLQHRSLVGGGRGQLRPKYFFRLRREYTRLTAQLGEAEAKLALAAQWKLSHADLAVILERLERPDASLDAPLRNASGNLGDTLSDVSETENQEEQLERKRVNSQLSEAVKSASAELDARERFILEHRLLADPDVEYSLVHIGRLFGVSRERARQLEWRVKEKIKRHLAPLLATLETSLA